jgi:hypothetical protein
LKQTSGTPEKIKYYGERNNRNKQEKIKNKKQRFTCPKIDGSIEQD